MTQRTNNCQHTLQLEGLEQRIALAGDVLIATDGINLALVGDADHNQIELRTVTPRGDLAIIGLEDTGLIVNGQPVPANQPVVVGAFPGAINVIFGEGNDVLVLHGTKLGSTAINSGAGADTVLMTPGTVIRGNLTIDLGTGDDRLAAHQAVLGGQLRINGGTGNDHLQLAQTVARSTAMTTGAGDDRLRIHDSFFGQLAVDLGEDSDVLLLARTHVAGTTLLSGGADDDLLLVGGNHLHHVHVGDFEWIDPARSEELATAELQAR